MLPGIAGGGEGKGGTPMRDEAVVRRFDLLELSPGDYWIVVKCGLLIMTLAYIIAGLITASTGEESWLFVFTPPAVGVVYSAWMIWAAHRRRRSSVSGFVSSETSPFDSRPYKPPPAHWRATLQRHRPGLANFWT
jgi:hypothetical protein